MGVGSWELNVKGALTYFTFLCDRCSLEEGGEVIELQARRNFLGLA